MLDDFRKNGFVRARIDGEIRDLDEDIKLAKTYRHNIDLIVDRLVIRSGIDFKRRLTDSLETVTSFSDGIVTIMYSKKDEDGKTVEYEKSYSEDFACTDCGISFQELTPRMFSFNAPQGACPACNGIGSKMEMNPDLVVPNKDLSLNEGLDRRAAAHTPLRHKRKGLIQLQAQKQKLSCQPQIRGSHCKA